MIPMKRRKTSRLPGFELDLTAQAIKRLIAEHQAEGVCVSQTCEKLQAENPLSNLDLFAL